MAQRCSRLRLPFTLSSATLSSVSSRRAAQEGRVQPVMVAELDPGPQKNDRANMIKTQRAKVWLLQQDIKQIKAGDFSCVNFHTPCL